MRTHKTKENFIARLEKEIVAINELLNFYKNVYLPTLQKFNGKVYNKRFINALNEQKTNDLINIKDKHNDEIIISIYLEKHNYHDCKQMYCMLLVNNEYRIDYNATINDKIGNIWIENLSREINEIQYVIENYDNLMRVVEDCQKVINEYSELPYQLRNNIAMDKIWYLK